VIDQGELIEVAMEVSATIRVYIPEVVWRQSFTEQRPMYSRKIGKSTRLEARLPNMATPSVGKSSVPPKASPEKLAFAYDVIANFGG